ncbi:MAG TPA: stage III sporulation protein AE, partial [Candidatus Atribacteria bacterium]|nr:stage III sporulation protein AE [Candidatus Atribacteria bacterium]
LFPMLIAMLAAMGNIATSAMIQPVVGMMVGTVGTLLKNTMIPLISLSAVITLMNHVSEKIRLDKLGKLLKNLCVWILTGTFTIFIGVLTLQGAMTASFDGISIRTAKFAIDAFVPIMGKLFSQTVDAVVSCSLLVKNAVGVAGLIILSMLCLIPALKILALLLTFKLSSALLEPVTDKRVVECLNDIGNILIVLFVTVIGIAIMFYLTVALIIGTGNISAMLR